MLTVLITFVVLLTLVVALVLDHKYQVAISTTITYSALAAALFCLLSFVYYPYGDLPTLEAKAAQAIQYASLISISVLIAFTSMIIGNRTAY